MFKCWQVMDEHRQMIQFLRVAIGILLLMIGLLWWGWAQAPKKLTVYVPPDLSSGVTLNAHSIPKSTVYALTFYVWQGLNAWQEDGVVDYPQKLHRFSAFLTQRFQAELTADKVRKQDQGELQRRRFMQGERAAAYESAWVTGLAPDVWEVILQVKLTEFVGETEVKSVNMEYSLRVVRMDAQPEHNPWGLLLDGFTRPPTRVLASTDNV